jgi:RNA polymerase sigma-70 factor (ECF subfamily)
MMHSVKLSCDTGIAQIDYISRRDEELLAAVRGGSSAAFEELQKLYSNRLYKRILSITKNHEDAEDALQDTFMRAFVALNSFEGRSRLSTWLTRIAINSALMIIRRHRSYVEVSFAPPSRPGADAHEFDIRDSAPNPEEICDLKQRSKRLFRAIEQLDPISRTAIGIRITQKGSMKEIAHTLDVSVATVKARLHRARKKLAKNVDHTGRKPASQKHGSWELRNQNRAERCMTRD